MGLNINIVYYNKKYKNIKNNKKRPLKSDF